MRQATWIRRFRSARERPEDLLRALEKALRKGARAGKLQPVRLLECPPDGVPVADEALVWALQHDFFAAESLDVLHARYSEVLMLAAFPRWGVFGDDAVEETQALFVNLWFTRFRTYDPDRTPFRGYLTTVVRNRAVQRHRQRKRLCFCPEFDGVSGPGDPAEEAVFRELLAAFGPALAGLPLAEREVFERSLDGQSLAQTAQELGLDRGAVSRLLNHAWARLCAQLALDKVRKPRGGLVPGNPAGGAPG